jgi:hypothetical protein
MDEKKIKKMIKDIEKKRPRTKEERIKDQLSLIAGYDIEKKKKITLSEIIDRKMIRLPELTEEQKSEITIDRINAQKEFKIYLLEEGKQVEISKDLAIEEISKGSDLGKTLIDTEMRAIQFAFEAILKQKEGK